MGRAEREGRKRRAKKVGLGRITLRNGTSIGGMSMMKAHGKGGTTQGKCGTKRHGGMESIACTR